MPCTLSNGFARDCSDSTGGIEELYILERASVTAYTVASHEVTAITDGGSTWRKYELKKEVGSIVATTTIDPASADPVISSSASVTTSKSTFGGVTSKSCSKLTAKIPSILALRLTIFEFPVFNPVHEST